MVGRNTEFVAQCSFGSTWVAIRVVDIEGSVGLSQRV